jgi:ATP-dependent helicase/nuclease subunit A
MEIPAASIDSLTLSQRQAVQARGNVLVMAGAGTGKTKTLVERCLDCLARDGAVMDELLVVTFTEAAAAEMRQRLLRAIEAKSEMAGAEPVATAFWQEQLARFELAHIGTLHSFCLKLVREHFYELGLDPRLAMLDEGEARQLANETLEELFQAHYAGEDEFSLAVQTLIRIHGGGRDEKIRALTLRLHHYSQARPDAAGWLARHAEYFSAAEPPDWQPWLVTALEQWRDEWLAVLAGLKSGNEKAMELADILAKLKGVDPADPVKFRAVAAGVLQEIMAADAVWPSRRKTILKPPLEDIFTTAKFLRPLATIGEGKDPLVEDWSWIHEHMQTLLQLAQAFAQKLAERKRSDGVLDFHDLEQFALKLLWDFSADKPTAVAETCRRKLKFVFVDEYQDINAAQDRIIAALSRDGQEANRFLVGDVKQSIYRFRLADPAIFRNYAQQWRDKRGQTISLAENFRSRAGLLDFVNSVFHLVMREAVGGVDYDAAAELKPGRRPDRTSDEAAKAEEPSVELLLRIKTGRQGSSEDENDALAGLDDTQREARLIARRLKQLTGVQWRDIAILLRSPSGRSEVFAKEFERAGIPLAIARGRFYQSAEILDLLSLLQLLDNPLQDVPCIAVLRSPLVGLSLDELAEIRLAAKEKHFWTALIRSQKPVMESEKPAAETEPAAQKVRKFLARFSHWRKLAKQISLSQCLEEILAETFYAEWLRAQPRGAQRVANVTALLQLAQQFDQFQRQGLFRFLKFVTAQQEAEVEPEVPALTAENAVRLMSIHQSKGLEFPVVVLADLGKRFNERDLHGEIIFDEEFGLCSRVKPPTTGRRYPSLPYWLAQRRQRRELRGEELRLLYVALTRAREQLILTAGVSDKNWRERWRQSLPVTTQAIAGAKNFADWLSFWFAGQNPPVSEGQTEGVFKQLRWQMVADETLGDPPDQSPPGDDTVSGADNARKSLPDLDDAVLETLRGRLEWNYPFTAATERKAKSSVTALRREAEELDDEAEKLFQSPGFTLVAPARPSKGKSRTSGLDAAQIGAAHHKFLQYVALENIALAKTAGLTKEAERLVREHYLSAEESAVLDLAALAEFWSSPLGRQIIVQAPKVRRELPFTARFDPMELEKITGRPAAGTLTGEFVVVQGVVDLMVLLPEEIWVVDFKTDQIRKNELADKITLYRPQLQLYALALEKIFNRQATVRALHFLSVGHTENV